MKKLLYIFGFFFATGILVNGQSGQLTKDTEICPGKVKDYYVPWYSYMQEDGTGVVFEIIVDGGEVVAGSEVYENALEYFKFKIKWIESGKNELQIKAHNKYNCYGYYNQEVNVLNPPDVSLDPAEVCDGVEHEFSVTDGYEAYFWTLADGTTVTDNNSIKVKKGGAYTVEVTDSKGCETTVSAELTVHDLPILNLGKDTMLCNNDSYILSVSSDYTTEWSTGATTSNIFVSAEEFAGSSIWAKSTNEFGCENKDTVNILVCNDASFLQIPTVFTPNGDGRHDKWIIQDIENYPDVIIEVFDRWGNIVFSSDGYNDDKAWDGTYNGKELPMDSYYFVIDLRNGYEPFNGHVTIVR